MSDEKYKVLFSGDRGTRVDFFGGFSSNEFQLGPTLAFTKDAVEATWKNNGKDYSKHLRIMPLVEDWDELDGLKYDIGDMIVKHFLGDKD